MTELDRPIKQLLRDPHVPVDGLWSRIEAVRSQRVGLRAPATRVVGFAGALAAVFAFAALAVILAVPPARESWGVASSHDAHDAHDANNANNANNAHDENDGPLLRSNGELLHVLDTTGTGAALAVALSDGSGIRLQPGAKLVTQRSDGKQFRVALERGKVTFDVKPGGPRRWIIDAGDSSVEVIGTRFSVERDRERVTVAVDRGKVAVRGPGVPEGLQVLGQGERLIVAPPPSAASAPPAASEVALQPEGELPTEPRLADTPSAPASEVTADQLLKAADAARATGDYRRAARNLQRFLALYPSDTRAAIVALTLGRLQLDQLASPKSAAISFARADRLGLPDAVAEEGAARLVEAYAKSGEKELARSAAARYGRRFPDGPRSANVAAWLDLD
ncbi:MAG TPA: FecR domain-containing protein [Polyangiales bacterium]|nr:FecR domain-containing protein [Polyangiales bacterium]